MSQTIGEMRHAANVENSLRRIANALKKLVDMCEKALAPVQVKEPEGGAE